MPSPKRIQAPVPFELWQIDLSQAPPAAAVDSLCEKERHRAERFVFERDRRRYLAAHCALRGIVSRRCGTSPRELVLGDGRHGKPFVVGPVSCAFNLSHSGDFGVLAIADEGEIGIDVELDQATADEPALVARYLSPAEVASWNALPHTERRSRFLYAWTRKEAILKALGCGLQLEPSGIDAGIELRGVDVAVAVEGRPRTVRVQTLVIDSSAIVSVARIVSVSDSPTYAAIAARR